VGLGDAVRLRLGRADDLFGLLAHARGVLAGHLHLGLAGATAFGRDALLVLPARGQRELEVLVGPGGSLAGAGEQVLGLGPPVGDLLRGSGLIASAWSSA